MKRQLKRINFVFSTCEEVSVSAKHLKSLTFTNLQRNIRWSKGIETVTYSCSDCNIVLLKSCDHVFRCFGVISSNTLFDRIIQIPDIECIELIYSGGHKIEVKVPWLDSDEINPCQTAKRSANKLSINIKQGGQE